MWVAELVEVLLERPVVGVEVVGGCGEDIQVDISLPMVVSVWQIPDSGAMTLMWMDSAIHVRGDISQQVTGSNRLYHWWVDMLAIY